MNPGNRKTGIFFAFIFFLGAIASVVIAVAEGKSLLSALVHPYVLISIAIALLMLGSAKTKKLMWLQPLVWFLAFLLAVFSGVTEDLTSFGFFVIAVLLLFRFGFYDKARRPWFAITIILFFCLEIASAIVNKVSIVGRLPSLFVITILLVTLYLAYQEKLMVYLKEPKETLSLKGKGLTDAEQKYVLALVGGQSPKEIAYLYEVSESTVRNTLARAYKKLGVSDRSTLAALAERVQLVT